MGEKKQRVRKPFEDLTITDNYMFQAVMRNPKHVKPLLEMVIGKKIRKIEIITPEKTVETGYNSRGIRMDVYVEDDENTVYDVEMQASKKWNLGKRFRFYQSAIDVDIVDKGEDFGKLKQSFIIFITTYDPYGKGWYMYPFETICTWDSSIKMDDAAGKIVLNTKGTKDKEGYEVNDEIKDMLSYMDGKTPESDYSKMLDDAVRQIKKNEERRLEYMNINTVAMDERIIGRYCGYIELIRSGKIDDEVFLSVTKCPKNDLALIKKILAEHPDWDDEDVADEIFGGVN